MPLSMESEIDLLYHLSTMSEHAVPKGIFYLLLWNRINQSCFSPKFSFNEMIEHLHTLFDESVFDNPQLPKTDNMNFQWMSTNTPQVEKENILTRLNNFE